MKVAAVAEVTSEAPDWMETSMSKLAKSLAKIPPPPRGPRRGPQNQCRAVYGEGDLEDWEAIDALRDQRTWLEVQAIVDGQLGVERPLPISKFRYHWSRQCYCWPEDLRR